MNAPKGTNGKGKGGIDESAVTIEFPCENYPVKIVGEATADYHEQVMETVEAHAPGFDRSSVTTRDSRNGRFQSITVHITATGEQQLKAMFEDLKQNPSVHMVL